MTTAGVKGALATQPLASLSGGQAVRVALARVALSAPHLLVLDEPSNHLDMVCISVCGVLHAPLLHQRTLRTY